jgi:hypothetical protein
MKDGPQGDEFASRLEVVEIGIDDDGDKITSCVIVPVEGLQPSRGDSRPKLTKGAKIALAALHEAIGECGTVPPASNHIPQNVKTVTIAQWREYAFRRGICSSDEPRAKRMAFQRASEGLIAAKSAAIWEPYYGHAREEQVGGTGTGSYRTLFLFPPKYTRNNTELCSFCSFCSPGPLQLENKPKPRPYLGKPRTYQRALPRQ